MTRHEKFKMTLERLGEQYANCRDMDISLPAITREAVAESVIRRFNICYDCLWKTLRLHLTERFGVADVPNSPKPVFRLAFENDLFARSLEQWMVYADSRVGIMDDYEEQEVQQRLEIVGDFLRDAENLRRIIGKET